MRCPFVGASATHIFPISAFGILGSFFAIPHPFISVPPLITALLSFAERNMVGEDDVPLSSGLMNRDSDRV